MSATSFSSFSIIELIIVINTKEKTITGNHPAGVGSVKLVNHPIYCLLYLVLLATPIPVILKIVIYLYHCPQCEDSDGYNQGKGEGDLDEPEAAALLTDYYDLGLPPQGRVLPSSTVTVI